MQIQHVGHALNGGVEARSGGNRGADRQDAMGEILRPQVRGLGMTSDWSV